MRICIDAGHGGTDPGAIGKVPTRLEEKAFNLAVAVLLEEELVARGHEVVMTRRQDRTLSLTGRARFANRFEVELFVSIHANAAASPAPEGIEVFCFPGSVGGTRFATAVQESLMATFPDHRDRGVKEANFTVLRKTLMPAILVECEFLTNPQQLEFLASEERQGELAQAMADSIDSEAA